MPSLKEAIADDAVRHEVAKECLSLVQNEVDSKGGLTGVALKTGYKAVRGIKPGFLDKVVYDLLPEFSDAVQPFVAEAVGAGRPIEAHLSANASRVADALLAITDKKAEKSTNSVVKGAYGKLRGMAKSNVEASVPGLARIIARHS